MTKSECLLPGRSAGRFINRASGLFRHSSFVIRHSLCTALLLITLVTNVAAKKKEKKAVPEGPPPPKFNVPIPLKRDAKGVKLPYFDTEGKLQMNFAIALATRIDNEHLGMKDVKLETYADDGSLEMTFEIPTSILDLNTRVITSDKPVTIRRTDFELTGETMTFNTETRSGKLAGKVRMLIYNRSAMTENESK